MILDPSLYLQLNSDIPRQEHVLELHAGRSYSAAPAVAGRGLRTRPIPPLESPPVTEKGEGVTDFDLYIRPHHEKDPVLKVKALMIFVDFRDAVGSDADLGEVEEHLLGSEEVQRLFRERSYGALGLQVEVKSDLKWRRMSKKAADYKTGDFSAHKDYLEEAARLFQNDTSIPRFDGYDMVLIAAPPTAELEASRAFTAAAGDGADSGKGEIRLAVTLNGKNHTERVTTLVHEIGHLFGLPDHYPAGRGAEESFAGVWSIMSDVFRASGFLGWHRHKNGWLDDRRKAYLTPDVGQWSGTLHPLSAAQGLSMVVIPIDDRDKPTKVLVIELAQAVRPKPGEPSYGQGILLYTVDLTLGSGCSPVRVLPKRVSPSPNSDHGNLPESPVSSGR